MLFRRVGGGFSAPNLRTRSPKLPARLVEPPETCPTSCQVFTNSFFLYTELSFLSSLSLVALRTEENDTSETKVEYDRIVELGIDLATASERYATCLMNNLLDSPFQHRVW